MNLTKAVLGVTVLGQELVTVIRQLQTVTYAHPHSTAGSSLVRLHCGIVGASVADWFATMPYYLQRTRRPNSFSWA